MATRTAIPAPAAKAVANKLTASTRRMRGTTPNITTTALASPQAAMRIARTCWWGLVLEPEDVKWAEYRAVLGEG